MLNDEQGWIQASGVFGKTSALFWLNLPPGPLLVLAGYLTFIDSRKNSRTFIFIIIKQRAVQ